MVSCTFHHLFDITRMYKYFGFLIWSNLWLKTDAQLQGMEHLKSKTYNSG